MIRLILIFIIVIHGLIHLLGFVKAYTLAEVHQLTQEISKTAGLLWLFSTILFILTAAAMIGKKDWWWVLAASALVISQLLIFISWKDAKFGTLANLIILTATILAYAAWSFNAQGKNEVKFFLLPISSENKAITKEMTSRLPPLIQNWLVRSKVINHDAIQIIHLKQKGEMRTSPGGKWMPVEAEQWSRTKEPGFLWLAKVAAAPGIELAGKDKYENGKGHMLIKLLSLFPVANAKGMEIDQGALVRYLAEIVWYPTAAVNDYIQWEQVDSATAKATMNYRGVTASGFFGFNANGDVISFEAKRYYDRKGHATLEDWWIQIQSDGYKEFEGVRIAANATVTWKLKEGNFTWFKLEVTDLSYKSAKIE
jgi:hypothetical protein